MGMWAIWAVPVVLVIALMLGFTPIQSNEETYESELFSNQVHIDDKKIPFSKTTIPFITNQGQLDDEVLFYVDTFTGRAFVTNDGLTYTFSKITNNNFDGVAVKEIFGKSKIYPVGISENAVKFSYFNGNENWFSSIPSYDILQLGHPWPNINVQLKADGNNIEKILNRGKM